MTPSPDGLRQASMDKRLLMPCCVLQKEVMPDLNPHLKDDTIDKMVKLIQIARYLKAKRKASWHSMRLVMIHFLQKYFYMPSTGQTRSRAILLNIRMLLCLPKQTTSVRFATKVGRLYKGQAVKKYRITQVFPAGLKKRQQQNLLPSIPIPLKLDALDNLIALDEGLLQERYLLSPTVEEYGKLHEIKTQLTKELWRNCP